MKDKKERAAASAAPIGSSSSTTSYQLKATTLNGMKALLIRKKSTPTNNNNNQHPEDLLLGSIKEFLLYSKLKSLIPPTSSPPLQERMLDNEMGAVEVELEPHECLQRDSLSDEENPSTSTVVPCVEHQMLSKDHKEEEEHKQQEDRHDNEDMCNVECVIEEEDDEGDEGIARSFKPSIKIRRMDDSIHISTIVLKEVSLTSTLFRLLEEDKLDVVFEDHYRTETKAAHNIQVRLRPGYDVDGLEKKLRSWAGYST